jgi:hypothetical protein
LSDALPRDAEDPAMPIPPTLKTKFVEDIVSIKKKRATTKDERRSALDWCLAKRWADQDVAALERIDDETNEAYGWAMWPRE